MENTKPVETSNVADKSAATEQVANVADKSAAATEQTGTAPSSEEKHESKGVESENQASEAAAKTESTKEGSADASQTEKTEGENNLSTILGADIDDDDDEEAEEAEEEKPNKPSPILRGFLKLSNGNLIWSGKWAMSPQQYQAGDKGKFKYMYAGSKNAASACEPKDGKVQKPLNGLYNGYFMLKDESAPGGFVKVKESNLKLDFTIDGETGTYNVVGKGKNKFGDFNISGKFQIESTRFAVVKTYEVADSEDEDMDGDIDEEENAEDELAALQADNELSVEELRRKYGGDNEDGEPEAKKSKVE